MFLVRRAYRISRVPSRLSKVDARGTRRTRDLGESLSEGVKNYISSNEPTISATHEQADQSKPYIDKFFFCPTTKKKNQFSEDTEKSCS